MICITVLWRSNGMTDLLFYGRFSNAMSSMLSVRMGIGLDNNSEEYKTALNL